MKQRFNTDLMDGWMGAKVSPGSYNAYIVQHPDRHREV